MTHNRFLAIVSDRVPPAAGFAAMTEAKRRLGFRVVLQHGRLCVLAHQDAASAPTDDGLGVMIGAAFPPWRPGTSGRGSLKVFHNSGCAEAGPWGGFVEFRVDEEARTVDITRDPSGMAPCFTARRHDSTWVFSDLEIAIEAGLDMPAIDWTGVAHYLAFPHLPARRTCLAGVDRLLPGARLRLTLGQPPSLESAWSPWSHAGKARRISDYANAVRELRNVTLECVGAWAAQSQPVLLQLSGGLDSSIIAACLSQKRAAYSCVTFATKDASGDERRHARLVAKHLGVPLRELHLDASDSPPVPQGLPRTPIPSGAPWRAVIDAALSGVINDTGANRLFSGGGGDNVFCYLTTAAPAADALRAYGPGFRFFAAARDVARLHRASVWRASRYAVRKAYWARPKLWPCNDAFLTRDAASIAPPAHPWFDPPHEALPGKLEQTASIASAVAISDGGDRRMPAALCYPLLSLPVIETCLTIPTWMWVKGGRNRAVARDAFEDLLPPETLSRRTKGDLIGLIAAIYRANKSEIEMLLLEGRLAREGIVDRDAVANRMREAGLSRDANFAQLVTLAAVEGWIQSIL